MRKKLIGILLILLAALVIVQDYFIKWEISIWMLAWVVLLAILSLSSLLKRHFGLGFAYGIVALFSLNGQFHFLPVSNSVLIFSSILAVIGLNILFMRSSATRGTWDRSWKFRAMKVVVHGSIDNLARLFTYKWWKLKHRNKKHKIDSLWIQQQ